jgi:hypothetical protein
MKIALKCFLIGGAIGDKKPPPKTKKQMKSVHWRELNDD